MLQQARGVWIRAVHVPIGVADGDLLIAMGPIVRQEHWSLIPGEHVDIAYMRVGGPVAQPSRPWPGADGGIDGPLGDQMGDGA
jgi:hypothetical protein